MTPAPAPFYRQLDGLRAVAVFGVIAGHGAGLSQSYFAFVDPGPAGVRVFFVLSGFLITGLLVRARATAPNRHAILVAFYARRCLRIFPLYYATLGVAAAIGIRAIRDHWPWYVTYSSNLHAAATGRFDPSAGHFWSLAVEEQFYLVWPLLVLVTPARHLRAMIVTAIAASGLFRVVCLAHGYPIAAYVLMPARLDALALGGLLSVGLSPRTVAWAGGIGLLGGGLTTLSPDTWWTHAAVEWAALGVSLWVVDRVQRGRGGTQFEWPWLAYLGRISYGLYVVHFFIPETVEIAERALGVWLPLPDVGWIRIVYFTILSVIAASLSWYLLEGPVLRLKRLVPYAGRRDLRAGAG